MKLITYCDKLMHEIKHIKGVEMMKLSYNAAGLEAQVWFDGPEGYQDAGGFYHIQITPYYDKKEKDLHEIKQN